MNVKMDATYSPEDNKLRLYASERLDTETYARVSAAGFSWAPRQKLFVAPAWSPEREDLLLELCDDIEDEEMTLEERAEVRAGRFEGYSARRGAEAESARKAVGAIAESIPLAQPILVGHHSERKARKDAERIESGMRKALKLRDTAEYWERRAEGVLHHANYKALPAVRARRIKTLEADQRRHQRSLKSITARIEAWRKVAVMEDEAAALAIAVNVAVECDDWRTRDALRDGSLKVADAAEKKLASLARAEVNTNRWIAHLTNRLAYERVLLGRAPDEVTKVDRTRKGAAALPLLNYVAPSGRVEIQNRWRRGEVECLRQATMTAAEFKRIHDEYKGTRVAADGSHRVRIAVLRSNLREDVAVFLSDSKAHPIPQPKAPPPVDPEPEEPEDVAEEELEADVEPTEPSAPAPVEVEPAPAPPVDPFAAMRAALKTGVKAIAVPQLFETSAALAARVVEEAGVEDGDLVLEPEAGLGAIATAARAAGGKVTCVEINHDAAARLRALGFTVRRADFLDLSPEDFGVLFDRVTMNPPFRGRADIRHVVHALRMVRVGGTLAAIMSASVATNSNKLGKQFRAFVDANGGTMSALPEGSFAEAGTNVRTVLVTMTRAPAAVIPPLPELLPDGWRDPVAMAESA